jgi:hypothetical protein
MFRPSYLLIPAFLILLVFSTACKKESSAKKQVVTPTVALRDTVIGWYDGTCRNIQSTMGTTHDTTYLYSFRIVADSIDSQKVVFQGDTITIDSTYQFSYSHFPGPDSFTFSWRNDSAFIFKVFGGLGGYTSNTYAGKKR